MTRCDLKVFHKIFVKRNRKGVHIHLCSLLKDHKYGHKNYNTGYHLSWLSPGWIQAAILQCT